MKLIVGLGNPGRKYAETRHNIGFDVLSNLARKLHADPPREKFEGYLAEAREGTDRILLLWPQTFMNLSGASVGKVRDFYKIDHREILVIADDFNLPLGKLRYRARGSAGGQKGLADILRRLGTEEVDRLRIGVGPVPRGWDPAKFVLGKFSGKESETVEAMVRQATASVVDWIRQGIDYCMNTYNAASAGENKPTKEAE